MKKLFCITLALVLMLFSALPAVSAAKTNEYSAAKTAQSISAVSASTQEKAGATKNESSRIGGFLSKIWDFIVNIIEKVKSLFQKVNSIDFNPAAAPTDYETSVNTGGEIEKTYLAHGKKDVSYFEETTTEKWAKYEIYYPSELKDHNEKYPVIVVANGSGVRASRYPAVFNHYASWGFIVIGNEHDTAYAGDSADASLAWLINANDDPDSVFYRKVDLDNVGIVGHSQGGVGTFAAITSQTHSNMYKTAVSLSPVPEESARVIHWDYDPAKIQIPVMVLAGTENDTISSDQLAELYSHIGSDKVTAIRCGMNHPQMLYSADGYVTAWFMWQLQGDGNAAKAFTGTAPEILNNTLYCDQQIHFE